jgi:predicted nucleotidyltransferase
MDFNNLPENYQNDIKKAADLLKSEDCKSIFLFGSMVTGRIHQNSDIDIGIMGLPPDKFFRTYSHLDGSLNNKVDLVDFDENKDFYIPLLTSLDEVVEIG